MPIQNPICIVPSNMATKNRNRPDGAGKCASVPCVAKAASARYPAACYAWNGLFAAVQPEEFESTVPVFAMALPVPDRPDCPRSLCIPYARC